MVQIHQVEDEIEGDGCKEAADASNLENIPIVHHESTEDLRGNDCAVQSERGSSPEPTSSPSVLYCLIATENDKDQRNFYKDTPWKEMNISIDGAKLDEDTGLNAVVTYYVQVDVTDRTNKKGNTSKTWRQEPTDFELGRDAIPWTRYSPGLKIHSEILKKIVQQVLDYYPQQSSVDYIHSRVEDTICELMYCYAELRSYCNAYIRSLPAECQADHGLDLGTCGDHKLQEAMQPYLDFGSLNPSKNPCNEDMARDIAVLLRLLAPMYQAKMVPALSSMYLDSKPTIKYATLWTIFRPGSIVYYRLTSTTGNRRHIRTGDPFSTGDDQTGNMEKDDFLACVVAGWTYEKKGSGVNTPFKTVDRLEVDLWTLQYDGTTFQRAAVEAVIVKFEGIKVMTDLQICPSDVYDRLDEGCLRKRLQKRGHKYLSIVKEPAAYREYNHPRGDYHGQIIVDPGAYREYAKQTEPGWDGIRECLNQMVKDMVQHLSEIDQVRQNRVETAAGLIDDGGGGKRFGELLKFDVMENEAYERIDEVRLLLPWAIEGFSIKDKKWRGFEIDHISNSPPVPSPNQLESELVLVSDADKEVLRTVFPKGEHPIGQSPDFVSGKGEGKVFLLYGPPGTGKTLTVECLANDTGRPLLHLTAEDVGLTTDAESNLRTWFTLAAKWDAVLLIDEADLFLEQRKDGDIGRNCLATVFLKTMEYYKGVLFLTTNRPGHIDDSFISRITCPIAYHHLSPETKEKIVNKFVKRFEETGTVEVEQAAVNYLIRNFQELNGRQIRNVLQSAVASAEVRQRAERRLAASRSNMAAGSEDPVVVIVKLHDVKAGVVRQGEFREYLKSLRGRDEPTRARNKQDYLATVPCTGT